MATNKASLGQLEDTLELYLVKKAPFQLPENVKEVIVKFAPWVTLILMVLTLPLILSVFGLGALLAPFATMLGPTAAVTYGTNYLISTTVLAVSIILELIALPGLFKRSIKGWRLIFYASLLSIASSFLSFNFVGGIINGLIGLYFLFQIKNHYK